MILQKTAASVGLIVSVAAAGLALAAPAAGAAVAASTRTADASMAARGIVGPISSQDRTFMDEASQINLTEISLGSYMRALATLSIAKNLGASYARDHTAAQANLHALALRLHVTLPATPGSQSESLAARIEAQKGKSMDAAFAKASVEGHQAAIAIFKKEEGAGTNPAVKAYAARYLPMLQMHLRWAEHAESAIGATPAK
jgi:putative membrane protein